jgi:hypothetical protein
VAAYLYASSKYGQCIAFESDVFDKMVVERTGTRVFKVLAERGYLVKPHADRNTYQLRIPKSEPALKPRMVVIRHQIMLEDNES